jgi:hypothetical protein
LYKFIFAIVLLFVANSNGESGYSVADEMNSDMSSQSIFHAFTDIELDTEPNIDLSMTNIDKNNRILQLTYLSKYSSNTHLPLLNSKFQYLRPRAPPFIIV